MVNTSLMLENKIIYLFSIHTSQVTDRKGVTETITAQDILLATGMRPRYPDVPGAKEYAISRLVIEGKIL